MGTQTVVKRTKYLVNNNKVKGTKTMKTGTLTFEKFPSLTLTNKSK